MGVAPQFLRLSADDGYRFAVRAWAGGRPDSPGVLIVHGIQSHGGWFEGMADHLVRQGVTVLMPDRRGSGANQADRGHAASCGQLINDLRVCMDYAEQTWAIRRIHVVGISWGGKLALALARRWPRRVSGLTLVAPGIYPKIDLPFSVKVSVGAACVFRPRRRFAIPLDDPRLFTANPRWLGFIESDPLRLRQVTASFLLVSKRLDVGCRLARPPGLPIQLMLAEHDAIVDNGRLEQWLRCRPGINRRINVYRGAHHTLEFEPDPRPYWNDLYEWICRCEDREP